MLNVLSSGKDIQLHEFSTLESKFSLKRSLDPRKFFIFPQENTFVTIYQDNRVDLLQAYQDDKESKIKRIKKFKLDGVTCGSVLSKDGKHEIAMGLSNGNIEFVDFNTKSMMDKKFSSDTFGNGVVNIDFNSDYNVLGGTYESGELQLFDMKKIRKSLRYKLDMKSDLVRFHPTSPQLVAVSSLAGGLIVLDINIKRTMYYNAKAHKFHSKDICWSPSSSSILMSVGSDCLLKIFDVRHDKIVSQTKHTYPYSTVAMSPCGNFCCAGNMKGSIISYDLRNLNNVLHTNSCHEGSNVNKLSFLPCSLVPLVNTEENESELDSELDDGEQTEKSSNKRASLLAFFDSVMPQSSVKRQSNDRKSIDEFFSTYVPVPRKDSPIQPAPYTPRRLLEPLLNGETATSNNQSLVENKLNTSHLNLNSKNKRFTLIPSEMQQNLMLNCSRNHSSIIHESLMKLDDVNELDEDDVLLPANPDSNSNDKENNREVVETYKNILTEKNKDFSKLTSVYSNTPFISQLSEMCDKIKNLETRLDTSMYNVNEKIRRIDEKMDDLSVQIQQGFLSIHCAVWAVAESDVAAIKNMVSTIHQNYQKIEDVFIENTVLKEKLDKLQNNADTEDT